MLVFSAAIVPCVCMSLQLEALGQGLDAGVEGTVYLVWQTLVKTTLHTVALIYFSPALWLSCKNLSQQKAPYLVYCSQQIA